MISIRIKKYLSILFFVFVLSSQVLFAQGDFQNSLLNIELNKANQNSIHVKLFTKKAYKGSLGVMPRANNEYVILLPETSDNVPSKINLTNVVSSVKGISIKTQPYVNNFKGYTKITLRTNFPTKITVSTVTSSNIAAKATNKTAKNAASEKPKMLTQKTSVPAKTATASKKTVTNTVQQHQNVTKPTINAHKVTQTKVVQNKPKTIVTQKTVQLRPKVTIPPAAKTINKQVAVAQKPAKTKLAPAKSKVTQKVQAPAPKTAVKPVAKKELKQIATPQTKPVPVVKPTIKENVAKQISQTKPSVVNTQPKKEAIPQKEVKKSVANIPAETKPSVKEIKTQPQPQPQPATPFFNQQNKVAPPVQPANLQQKSEFISNFTDFIQNNLYIVIAVILIPIIILLLILRNRKGNKAEIRKKIVTPSSDTKTQEQDIFNDYSETQTPVEDAFEAYQTQEEEEETFEDYKSSEEIPSETYEEQPENTLEETTYQQTYTPSEELPIQNIQEPPSTMEEDSTLNELDELLHEEGLTEGEDVSLDELFNEDEEDEETIVSSEQQITTEVPEVINQPHFEETIEEAQEGEDEDDELVKSEYQIDAKRGFYLVDFEGKTTLLGHIEDEIFVLKQFEKQINDHLQVRLDEENENSFNFMVKVGRYKALVEVMPENMKLLIEL